MSPQLYYVADGESVLVLHEVVEQPNLLFVPLGIFRLPPNAAGKAIGKGTVLPSFEVIGKHADSIIFNQDEIENGMAVWWPGRPAATRPSILSRESAEKWVKTLKRGEVREWNGGDL